MESIKEKIYDRVLDEVFDLVMGKSKDELIEIIFRDDLKKTLYKVMKDFSKSEHFKYQFSEYSFSDNSSYISNFDEEMFKLTLSFSELEENIGKVVKNYFNSDCKCQYAFVQKMENKNVQKLSFKLS